MGEPGPTVTKDPSLKRYFKFMLTNRKMSVQFTSRKIREIIELDLGIKLEPTQSLYARVCIEAFAYYMQSWPEWNLAIKSQYSEALYECLITYLRNKLLYLKQREQGFKQANIEKNTVVLQRPENMQIVPQKGFKKVKAPYSLKVNVPKHLWNSTKINLRNYGTHHIYLEFGNIAPIDYDLGIKDILSYPFIYTEFCLPGLITFNRSTPFKVERYLQTLSDDTIPTETGSLSVVDSDPTSPHKVYTYQLMTALFNCLNKTLAKFKAEIPEALRLQISVLCDAFLLDIFETNIKKTTVCEGSTVTYNIGKSTYFSDSELNNSNSLNEKLVYRKLLTPILSYNLKSCDVNHSNVLADGNFEFFNFKGEPNRVKEMHFVQRIKTAITYKCLVCDAIFSLSDLKDHLKEVHPTHKKLKCVKCLKRFTVGKLLIKRWKHECNHIPFPQNNK